MHLSLLGQQARETAGRDWLRLVKVVAINFFEFEAKIVDAQGGWYW